MRKWKSSKYSSSFSQILIPHNRESKINCVHRYPICTRSHSLENCQEFKKMNLKQSKDFLMKMEMCFGYFGFSQFRKKCKICNKAHPTLLHDRGKNASLPENSKQTPSENSPSSARLDNTTNSCISVRNSIGSCQEMTSSMILPLWLYRQDKPNCQVMVYAL